MHSFRSFRYGRWEIAHAVKEAVVFWGKMAMKSVVEKRRKDVGHNPDAPHRLKNVTSASPACAHLPLPVIVPLRTPPRRLYRRPHPSLRQLTVCHSDPHLPLTTRNNVPVTSCTSSAPFVPASTSPTDTFPLQIRRKLVIVGDGTCLLTLLYAFRAILILPQARAAKRLFYARSLSANFPRNTCVLQRLNVFSLPF